MLSCIPVQFDIRVAVPEGCNMINTYESLNERFPILDVIIKHLSCADTEKGLLKELFVTVYRVGYGDGQAAR
jgi:hypothetical protein